jgi:predicted phosphodiesterase
MVMPIDWSADLGDGPILVFGGPYSNVRATRALRALAQNRNIPARRVICTGDVVAYAAEPQETIDEIRDWGCKVIAGNCERQLSAKADDCGCGFTDGSACDRMAKGWYPFADARVSNDARAWMRSLPATARFMLGGRRWAVVHGGADVDNRFMFASQRDLLETECAATGCDVVLAGHAGLPFIARLGRSRAWFNPGVIGMPANDGTPDGWFGLVTPAPGAVTLSIHRFAYDHRGASAAMRRFAHADGYARTLIDGRWPSLEVLPEQERAATGRRLPERSVRLACPRPAVRRSTDALR